MWQPSPRTSPGGSSSPASSAQLSGSSGVDAGAEDAALAHAVYACGGGAAAAAGWESSPPATGIPPEMSPPPPPPPPPPSPAAVFGLAASNLVGGILPLLRLEVLQLSVFPLTLGDAFAEALARLCPALRCLALASDTRIGDRGVAALVGSCPLESLTLVRAPLTDASLRLMAARAFALRRLVLQGCDRLTEAGVQALARAPAALRHLRFVDLSYCKGLSSDAADGSTSGGGDGGGGSARWGVFTFERVCGTGGALALQDDAAAALFKRHPALREFLALKPHCRLALSYGG